MLSYPETARLCRETALLIHSGIPLADGFFLLAREEDARQMASLEAMGTALDRGCPLSEAMEQSGLFSPYVFRLVRIGEETGRVEEALVTLADYYEQQERTRRQIRSAVAYPGMLFCLMMTVLAVLLIKVLPVFDRIYGSLGVQMTGAAALMLHLGNLMKGALPVFCGLLLLLMLLGIACRWHTPFRERLESRLQNFLGDRGIARKFRNARFAQGLSMGFGSGLHPEAAAELAESLLEGCPSAVLRSSACRKALSEGVSLWEAMEQGQLLSPAQGRMLRLGIQSGSADQVIRTIAQQLQEEAEEELEAAVSRIEPAMVLTVSALIGLILLAVMLPLMDILSVLG